MRGCDAGAAPIRVLHVIPHLGQGGAEAALAALLAAPQPGIEHTVCTLFPAERHQRIDQPVLEGPGRRGVPSPVLARHVRDAVRRLRPHIVQGWMYHANLLTAAAIGTGARILWSIHGASPGAPVKRMTRWVAAAGAALSHRVPDRILYVAEAARAGHEAAGYAPARGVVLPNGIDLDRFRPVPRPPADGVLRIGMAARYDPLVKGHHFLIEVLAAHPLRERIALSFAGQGCDTAPALRAHLDQRGLLARTTLHGALSDMAGFYAGIDLLALPSRSEALPMVVLEAAATGLPVCASRVGDIPRLGLPEAALFDAGDAAGCARALLAAAGLARDPVEAARQRARIAARFGIEAAAARQAALYRDLLGRTC